MLDLRLGGRVLSVNQETLMVVEALMIPIYTKDSFMKWDLPTRR